MRGSVCLWCGEAVTEAEARYEAADGTAVHTECAEEFLLETVGLQALAESAGYLYRREVEQIAARRKEI